MERTPAAAGPTPSRSRAQQALTARHNWVQLAKFCAVRCSERFSALPRSFARSPLKRWTSAAREKSASCPNGAGRYCGDNGVSGAPNVLFDCRAGKITAVQRCARGCQHMATGMNDVCAP